MSIMHTVLEHENHAGDFFLAHTQSSEISDFDIIFAILKYPDVGAILINPPPPPPPFFQTE